MKKFKDIKDADLVTYMNLLAQATSTIVPDDAFFLVVLFSRDEKATGTRVEYVGNTGRENLAKALRECANKMERGE